MVNKSERLKTWGRRAYLVGALAGMHGLAAALEAYAGDWSSALIFPVVAGGGALMLLVRRSLQVRDAAPVALTMALLLAGVCAWAHAERARGFFVAASMLTGFYGTAALVAWCVERVLRPFEEEDGGE